MRGFRGNRAVINFKSAHFGRQPQHHDNGYNGEGHHPAEQNAQNNKPRELPAWLRMPTEAPKKLERPVRATAKAKTAKVVSIDSARATKKSVSKSVKKSKPAKSAA